MVCASHRWLNSALHHALRTVHSQRPIEQWTIAFTALNSRYAIWQWFKWWQNMIQNGKPISNGSFYSMRFYKAAHKRLWYIFILLDVSCIAFVFFFKLRALAILCCSFKHWLLRFDCFNSVSIGVRDFKHNKNKKIITMCSLEVEIKTTSRFAWREEVYVRAVEWDTTVNRTRTAKLSPDLFANVSNLIVLTELTFRQSSQAVQLKQQLRMDIHFMSVSFTLRPYNLWLNLVYEVSFFRQQFPSVVCVFFLFSSTYCAHSCICIYTLNQWISFSMAILD